MKKSNVRELSNISRGNNCQNVSNENRSVRKEQGEDTAIDERLLIEAAQHGDVEAFNRLVVAYQDRAFHLAYQLLADPMDAEDAVQDAFISAYLGLSGYRGGSFRSWLFRIVMNRCLDVLRRRKRRPEIPFQPVDADGQEIESPYWAVDPSESPEAALLGAELSRQIQAYLEMLTLERRTILVLVDMLGMSYQEAGRIAGCPTGTVKSRLARARVQMRSYLRARPLSSIRIFSGKEGSTA